MSRYLKRTFLYVAIPVLITGAVLLACILGGIYFGLIERMGPVAGIN